MIRRFMLCAVLLAGCSEERELTVNPTEGNVAGGLSVRITGEAFSGHGPPVVHFGDASAKAVVVESDRLIRVKTPEVDQAGTVTVTITFADETVLELPDAFSYKSGNVIEIGGR